MNLPDNAFQNHLPQTDGRNTEQQWAAPKRLVKRFLR